ncbi:putative membrane protein [Toxoplasma gondii TgCatPRC2]|uniref:Putative membrane protein n=1 Tax=Toxoplasma gondii TgCatPRC2 TaxID=1130821 RepID=A0A151HBJ3_TOXGO|nr:putative membrane protein [Toxoplasma gondii TgCatPRC2]
MASAPSSSLQGGGSSSSSAGAAGVSSGRAGRGRTGPQQNAADLSYREAAPFFPAKIQSATPLPHVTLIKVPPFVAAAWRAAEKQTVVGVTYGDPKSKKKCIFGMAEQRSEAGRASEKGEALGQEAPGQKTRAPAPTCHLQCASVKPNKLFVLQQQSGASFPAAADVLCVVEESSNFVPLLDQTYHTFLRRRHETTDVFKTRGTIEETRRDTGFDSTATLFHFHTPKPAAASSAGVAEEDDEFSMLGGRRGGLSAAEAARTRTAKQKKAVVTIDEDSLKLRLFSIFEAAGANGLQLKQIAMQTGQPLSFVRQVVEEIAEPRKRASDRKTVFFLKDQYNPYASLTGEEPLAKKPKLT